MVAAKSGRTYSTWLLLKEGDELDNNNKFVKNMNNEGAAEKLLLSKIMKNHKKSNIRNPIPVDRNHSISTMYLHKASPVAQPFIPVIRNN
jgi:hypothetical protein